MQDDDELERASAFISQIESRFTTASTVPAHPHQYVARAWLAAEQREASSTGCRPDRARRL